MCKVIFVEYCCLSVLLISKNLAFTPRSLELTFHIMQISFAEIMFLSS